MGADGVACGAYVDDAVEAHATCHVELTHSNNFSAGKTFWNAKVFINYKTKVTDLHGGNILPALTFVTCKFNITLVLPM